MEIQLALKIMWVAIPVLFTVSVEEILHKRKVTKIAVYAIVVSLLLVTAGVVGSNLRVKVVSNVKCKIAWDGEPQVTAIEKVLYANIGSHWLRADYAGSDFEGFYEAHESEKICLTAGHIKKGLREGILQEVCVDRRQGAIKVNVIPAHAAGKTWITVTGRIEGEIYREGPTKDDELCVPAGIYSVKGNFNGKRAEDRVTVLGQAEPVDAWLYFGD